MEAGRSLQRERASRGTSGPALGENTVLICGGPKLVFVGAPGRLTPGTVSARLSLSALMGQGDGGGHALRGRSLP